MPQTRTLSIPLDVTGGHVEAGVTVHEPDGPARSVILYLHGGGLLYGRRDDLPGEYVDAIVARGHVLCCLDYPLAPETDAGAIAAAVLEEWRWVMEHEVAPRGVPYVLFGRSAGAWLTLGLARDVRRLAGGTGAPEQPAAILDFYGYFDLCAPFAWTPSRHYAKVPAVGEAVARALVGAEPITSAPPERRFSLYLHARQTGAWGKLLGLDEASARSLSLTADDLRELPPTFVAASTGDQDVPFGQSRTVSKTAPHATMHTVYYLEHDFDRDTTRPEGARAYAAALDWLDEVLTARS